MRKIYAILKAIISGNASIEYVDKTPIEGPPGEVTQGGHQ
jgi:hypothetical protein